MAITEFTGGSGTPETLHSAMQAASSESPQRPLHTEEGVFSSIKPEDFATNLFHGEVLVGRGTVPYTLEIPEEPATDLIGILSPGYLGIKQSSKGYRNSLARRHRIANLTFDPGSIGDESILDSYKDPQGLHAQTLWSIAADLRWRRGEIRQMPGGNQLNTGKQLLVAHSMGGLAIPRYAYKEPGSVYKMVGLMTCGLGYPSMAAMAADTPKNLYGSIKHEIVPAVTQGHLDLSLRNVRDAINYCRRLRFLFEGLSCLRNDVTLLVDDLKGKGIEYDYLAAKYDFLVRPDPRIANLVSHHTILDNIGHLAPQAKPHVAADYVAERALAAA